MLRWLVVALLPLAFAIACGGSEDPATSATATSSLRASASSSPTRVLTSTAVAAAETVAVTPAPEQPTQAPQAAVTPAPSQPPTPPPTNQAPAFPDSVSINTDTSFEYDDDGYLTGVITVITVPAAADPDGDSLTYGWSASNGNISGAGLTATWTRAVDFGAPQPGTVTVTVDDGRGGADVLEIEVQ